MLRVRPDLHLAFLRRAAQRRLRAVQLRDAGARPAVRGHPQRGVRDRQARAVRRGGGHQSVRADRIGRAAGPVAQADRRRAHHRHRRAGLRRADPCRGEGRAGRRDAALCPHRGRAGTGAAAAAGRVGHADGGADRRVVPGRSGRRRRAAGADGLGDRAADAVARMARSVRGAGLRGRRRGPSVLHRQRARVPRRRAAGGRLRPGRGRGHRRLAGRDRPRGRRVRPTLQRRAPCRRSAPRWRPAGSPRASPCPATKGPSCWWRGC